MLKLLLLLLGVVKSHWNNLQGDFNPTDGGVKMWWKYKLLLFESYLKSFIVPSAPFSQLVRASNLNFLQWVSGWNPELERPLL